MKDRGKAVEVYTSEDLYDQDYSPAADLPCKKHPSASSVGICPYCLKERLVNLVCSDCGEHRLSSCSCSEISSYRNSSCNVEISSVGRVSFLLENDQKNLLVSGSNPKPKSERKEDDVLLLKRSNSSCVEIKRKGGLWRIVRLFKKKREKGCVNTVGGFQDKSDMWVVDYTGVSRSRSLCSFRGGGFFGSEDGTFSGARSSISGARSSLSAARSSGVNGGLLFDPDRKSGFSEPEPRKSGFDGHEKRDATLLEPDKLDNIFNGANTRRVFSLKEGNFSTVDDSGFIDLKFDFPSESNPDFSAIKLVSLSDTNSAFGSMRAGDTVAQDHCAGHVGSFPRDMFCANGRSCRNRIAVSDRRTKKSRKSFKSWRWIFRYSPGAKKKDEGLGIKSVA
ncbi:hypothetical protein K2173_015323 [Erythroxylum novogranatense]|uniref:Uncharacterized protein n=1 Tax=Erythroxylum novogranatense TaxID=1862640 RepID=A0AAV8T1L7_9ROSI|nr:hypothetical protein K2173_015323 [Erythroxylum novogranatense]